jgi:hypothetical protein
MLSCIVRDGIPFTGVYEPVQIAGNLHNQCIPGFIQSSGLCQLACVRDKRAVKIGKRDAAESPWQRNQLVKCYGSISNSLATQKSQKEIDFL